MSRMAKLLAKRRDKRRDLASAAVSRILSRAAESRLDLIVVGSLAKDDFRSHSDVDFLVRGPTDAKRRLLAERLVAESMEASGLPYDLIFEADLMDDRIRELLDGIV